MKLADLGSCGGRLEMRAEARPCPGMPFSRDWPVRWDMERCTRACAMLSARLLLLGLVADSGVPIKQHCMCIISVGVQCHCEQAAMTP